MPTTIDRYLLRTYFRTLAIALLSMIGIFTVFDALTNFDNFASHSDGALDLLRLIGTHYAFKSLWIFDRTLGFLMLTSAVFTVAWFQYHNEMTALMMAGITRVRIVLPILWGSLVVVAVACINREVIMPQFRDELARGSKDVVGEVGRLMISQVDRRTGILLQGGLTYAKDRRVSNPKFLVLGDASEIAVSAEQAHYRPPQGDRPGGYLFEGDIKPKDLPALAKFEVDGERVILTHEDAPDWIGEDQCFVVSGVPFDQLTGGKAFRQFASTWEMVRGLRNPSLNLGSSGKTVIHGRIVQPFLDLALLLLGLPLVASRQDRNVFMAIGLGGLLATAFLVFALGCQSLGLGGMIPASLAAWLPLMVFIPVTVRLWHAM